MRKTLRAVFNIVFICLVLCFILHKHFYEILACLQTLSMLDLFILALASCIFFFLDSVAQYVVLKDCTNTKSVQCSIELVFLNHFFNGTTSSMGTIPFQSYYLKKRNIPYNQGIGAMLVNMIFHKLAVLVNALLVLLLQFHWMASQESIVFYIWLGLALNGVIIFGLILFIFLDKSKWIHKIKKEALQEELLLMAKQAKNQLCDRRKNLSMFFVHSLKVMWLCVIPYFCIRVLQDSTLNFIQIYALSSLAYILASSLPNVAGIGPLEFAYITLFSTFISGSIVSTSLILYRFFSFYILFIISTFAFVRIKKSISC